jgi:uncharacterized protein
MKKMNPVVHFELPAKDRKRMADFYTGVFGWKAQMLGKEMGNYVTVSTIETGADGRPAVPGAINGGLFPVRDDNNQNHPSVVIAVDDIIESSREVAKSGGKLIGEPMNIPGVGKYQSFVDTEGNTLSMLQPIM